MGCLSEIRTTKPSPCLASPTGARVIRSPPAVDQWASWFRQVEATAPAGNASGRSRQNRENIREVTLAYQGACSGVMPTYDGFIAKFMGDGVLAYFGYPRALEGAEWAVRAGLDIIAAVGRIKTRSGARLEVRIGGSVTAGCVVSRSGSLKKRVPVRFEALTAAYDPK